MFITSKVSPYEVRLTHEHDMDMLELPTRNGLARISPPLFGTNFIMSSKEQEPQLLHAKGFWPALEGLTCCSYTGRVSQGGQFTDVLHKT